MCAIFYSHTGDLSELVSVKIYSSNTPLLCVYVKTIVSVNVLATFSVNSDVICGSTNTNKRTDHSTIVLRNVSDCMTMHGEEIIR